MGKSEPRCGKLEDITEGDNHTPLTRLRLVVTKTEPAQDGRQQAVRDVRRSLGRLLRALPAADWNASAFPDVVVTQLAQYDSVTAAYLWGEQDLEMDTVDEAVEGMRGIERWVRGALSRSASAVVRCQELQVCILDEELRDPLVLSEWSGAFVKHECSDCMQNQQDDLAGVLAEIAPSRLRLIARRLGVASPVDWSSSSQERRSRIELAILEILTDPTHLSVLVSTLPDGARSLLVQLVGGCCDEGCLRQWAQLCAGEPTTCVEGEQDSGIACGHPVQLLRDCGLVFVDPACRLAVPGALVAPLRAVFGTLAKLDGCARVAR